MTPITVAAAFKVTIILLEVQTTVSEIFKVLSPDTPIIVSLGETAVLPCYLSPSTNAEDMMVRWFRSKFSFTVHLYQNRKNIGLQIPKYQNRTSFNTSLIADGKVSLSIHSIAPSDEGSYTCLFQSLSFYDAADLELKVSALGSGPTIFIEEHQDGHLRAVCKSYGWYPKPVVYWKDENEHIIHPLTVAQSQNALSLFDVEMILALDSKSNRRLSCVIRHGFLEQELKSTIQIADPMFLRVSRCVISRILMWTSFILIFLATVLLAFYTCFMQQKKIGKLMNENKSLLQKNESLTENLGDVTQEKERILEEKDSLLKKIEDLSAEIEWRKRYNYKTSVKLDPMTAHPLLVITDDFTHVKHGDIEQELPDNPERFSTNPCVLGAEGFTAGKHYWEAEVLEGGGWDIGAAKESVRKKGWIRLSPKEGIWTLRLGRDQYQALTAPYSTHVPIRDKARKMGVYLDYEKGQLSFFNVDTKKHIFTFNDVFTEKIYPFFNVWYEGLEIKISGGFEDEI